MTAPQWHIALTEPRRESLAAAHLRDRGIEPYLPTLTIEVAHGGHGARRAVQRPMFPGYLPVRFSTDMPKWQRLFTTPGIRPVHSLLRTNGHYAILPEAAIAAIVETENRLRHQRAMPAKRLGFQVGQTVQFKSWPDGGAFSGFFAEVERLDDSGRISLLVSIFGRVSRAIVESDLVASQTATM